MDNIITALLIMGGLGVFFGTVLALSYRFLRVEEDPRIEKVEEMLPGSNCGACGAPGCRSFAEQVISGEAPPSKCTVSSAENIAAIADFLGIDAGQQVKKVARLKCAGGKSRSLQIAEYDGYESCRAAALVGGGGKGCAWGCLGLADCERACTFGAIKMSEDGLPIVDADLCTACGDCVEACPKDLFVLVPVNQKLFVQCNIPLAGAEATSLCSVACDACGRCAADSPPGLVVMKNNLPHIDYSAGGPARPEITYRCPTGAIQWIEYQQFPQVFALMKESEREKIKTEG